MVLEELKHRHITALHKFNELYKTHVTLDLKARLAHEWQKLDVKKLRASQQVRDEITLIKPKSIIDLTVKTSPFKLRSATELGRTTEVSPALLIPGRFSAEQKQLSISDALDSSVIAFKALIKAWPEVFSHETSGGQLSTDFVIKRTKDTVRFCLSSKSDGVDKETVLYQVSIEHGRAGSKVKDYTAVYLNS
jgi:NDP-sugar pyrophosphorylase family protein